MNELIGPHLNINIALNRIEFGGAVPIVEWRGHIYHIDHTGRKRGQLIYTKFDNKTPLYSVNMPFSKTFTLGETLDRGDGLQKRLDPYLDQLPAEAFAVIPCNTKPVITKYK